MAATLGLLLTAAFFGQQGPSPEKNPLDATSSLVPIPLPAPRHGHRIERVDGGLLCFGGFGNPAAPSRESAQTWWLAPGAQQWERRADMAVGRSFFGSAVVEGDVYAIGDGVERFDRRADRWTHMATGEGLPRTHFAATAVGSTIYVLGGYGGDTMKLCAVDATTGERRFLPAPPRFKRGDHFHILQALGGQLHVIGGLDGESFVPKTEHWVMTNPTASPDAPPAECWSAAAPPPAPVWAKFAVQVVADGRLYLFGDFGAFRFDARKKAWTSRAPLPVTIVMPQAVALGGVIWVIGGERVDDARRRSRLLFRYGIAHDAWTDHSR
jgi:hypothetical protein